MWGDLFIVWEAWIVDTIKAGIYTANEADYEVPGIEGYCLELPEMPLEPARWFYPMRKLEESFAANDFKMLS